MHMRKMRKRMLTRASAGAHGHPTSLSPLSSTFEACLLLKCLFSGKAAFSRPGRAEDSLPRPEFKPALPAHPFAALNRLARPRRGRPFSARRPPSAILLIPRILDGASSRVGCNLSRIRPCLGMGRSLPCFRRLPLLNNMSYCVIVSFGGG